MASLLWILAGAAVGAFLVYTAFPVVFMLKGAKDARVWIPFGVRVVGGIWFVLGNAVHNIFVATVLFRDLPRELATSQRIQRYIDAGPERVGLRRWHKAVDWARFLNFADPKPHITGVPK